jgi:hypothetical protein
MFIKHHILILAAVSIVVAMTAEWLVASFWPRATTARYFHALCNTSVGQPYTDFVHRLRTLSDSGDTTRLNRALRTADERSDQIFEVWLRQNTAAYTSSLDNILEQ